MKRRHSSFFSFTVLAGLCFAAFSGSASATTSLKTISANPSMTQGTITSGNYASAQSSDGSYLRLHEATALLAYKLDAKFEAWQPFTEAPKSKISAIKLVLDANTGDSGDVWYARFWDYSANAYSSTWRQLGTAGFSTSNKTYTVSISDPALIDKFLDAGGNLKVELSDGNANGLQAFDFTQTTLNIDRLGVEFTYDNEPPSSAITLPANGAKVSGTTYTISGTASDPASGSGVSKVEVSTDGGNSWQTATGTTLWNYAWTLPINGDYSLKSRATDAQGNIETPSAGIWVAVSNPPKTILSVSPVSADGTNGWFKTAPTITLSNSDPGTTYYSWDAQNGPWTAYSGQITAPAGTHTLYYYSETTYGTPEAKKSQVFKVDTGAPASTVTAPAHGARISGTSYTISGTASDPLPGSGIFAVEVSTDGGSSWQKATGTASWSYAWTLPASGNYTVKARATDAAGNTDVAPTAVDVIVDRTAPTITSTVPRNGQIDVNTKSDIKAYFSEAMDPATINSSTFVLKDSLSNSLPGTVAYDQATKTATLHPAAAFNSSALYSATVTTGAKDLAGNSLAANQTWSFSTLLTIDLTPPTTAVSTDPFAPNGKDGWFVTAPQVTLASSEPGTTYYSWDAPFGPWTTYSAPFTAQDGEHTLYYHSVDSSGNQEASKSLLFKVDTAAPSTTLTANPSSPDGMNGWYNTTPTITLSCSEQGTIYFAWDSQSGPWTTYVSSFSAKEGQHTLYYYSVDQHGKAETAKSLSLKVDATAPTTTLSSNPASPDGANGWFKSAPTITLSSNEPGTIYYQWDSNSGAWNTYSGPFGSQTGQHLLFYYAHDDAGNTEFVKSQAIKVDGSAPLAPVLKGSEVGPGKIDFTWSTTTDTVSGLNEYKIYNADNNLLLGTTKENHYLLGGLTPGVAYRFYLKTIDLAGNTSPASNAITIATKPNGDNEPPAAPSSPQAQALGGSQIKVSWNPSWDNVGVIGYQVFDAATGGMVGTTTATSYSVPVNSNGTTRTGSNITVSLGLDPTKTYSYFVKAYDAAGNISQASNTVEASGKGISVNFPKVSSAGITSVTADLLPPAPPAGIVFLEGAFDLSTSATYEGTTTVGISYDRGLIRAGENNLKVFQYTGGQWVDVTSYVDMTNGIIYGKSSGFGPFALGQQGSAVPASSAPALIGSGLLGLAAIRRSLSRKSKLADEQTD